MASSNRTPLNPHLRTWGQWWRASRVAILVTSILVLLGSGCAYFLATSVQGVEFNAATWEVRRFSFHRDPLTNAQLTGVRHNEPNHLSCWSSISTANSAQIDPSIRKYLNPSSDPSDSRWDLVQISTTTNPGEADILIELLEAHDSSLSLFWIQWTSDHPLKAAEFWPAVYDLVLLRLYGDLPAIFQLALYESSPGEFSQSLRKQMQFTVHEHSQRLKASGQTTQWKQATQIGLRYGPNVQLPEKTPPAADE